MRLLVPVLATADPAAFVLAAAAFLALTRLRWGILSTLGVTTAAGLLVRLLL